jgi:outer membrane protein OmpA-like peptidoglycan-associated protein
MKNKILFFTLFLCTFAIAFYGRSFSQEPPEKTYDKAVLKSRVFFELSKSDLTPAAADTLNEVSALLRLYRNNVLVVEGHADSTGEEKYNKKLSDDRAKAVCNFFIENGIEQYRMKIVHYGDSKPLKDNLTESGRAENRRAEIIIFKGD